MLCLTSFFTQAQQIQNYPVQTTAYFAAPFSQRLSDYFSSDKRLLVDLLLKDLTKSTVQVYLKWSIDGVGIRVQSRDTYLPPSFITLQRGVVNRLRGSDLQANYFNPAAIETQGIDPRSIYAIELPEGFYTLKVQAFEAATGQVVSNVSETYMVLAYPQPPILNLPLVGSEVPVTSLQKVPISWAPRHFASPTTQAVYHLQVCEVPDEFDPTELVMLTCTEPRLDVTVPTTSYAGDITQWIKPLEVGKRYAVQVTVSDLSGELTNFVNQGRSQVSWFRYGKECVPPAFSIQSLGTDRVQLSWARTEGAQGYVVEYKLATAANWQSLPVSGTSQVIGSLNPTADYLFRMRSDCGGSAPSAASEIQSWNIRDEAPAVAPELPLALTNPIGIRVQTGVDGQLQVPTSLSALYSNYPRAVQPGAIQSGTVQSGPGGNTDPTSSTAINGSSSTNVTPTQGATNEPGSTTGSVVTSAQPGSSTSSTGTTPTGTGLPLLTLPYCAMQASSFAGCELPHPTVGLPTGDRELSSLSVGDVLGIYDYAVFVTKVGGGSPLSGEGLARLPFLNGTMVLVEFSGVSAKAGEPGTNGGCVYAISPTGTSMPGYFRIKRASQAEVLAAQRSLIASLVSKTSTDSSKALAFVGTLGEALAKYDSVVVSLGHPQSQTLSVATRQSLTQYTAAIAQGSESIKSSFESVYEGSRDPLVVGIRDSLAVLMSQVNQALTALQSGSRVPALSILTARYEALFAQLSQLTNPTTTTPASPGIALARLGNLTDSSVKLSWQGDPSFTKYVVHYKLEGGGELLQIVTSPTIELVKLKAGTNYTYSIDAYQGSTLVSSYGGTPFTTLTKSIAAPQNLAYTVQDDHTVKITWDKNSQHLNYKLVYTDESGAQRTVYPSSNEYTLKGLASNQAYPYEVIAYGSENLVSDAASNSFQVGTVCSAGMYATALRVIEGTEVTLTVSGCRDAGGKEGFVTWTGKGLPQTFGTTQVFRPSETATYTSHCQLQVDNGNGPQPVTCSDTKTITVDKACTGVVAKVSPTTIDQGQPIVLQSTGCASDIRWGIGYPIDAGLVSTKQSAIIYSTATQNKSQTYTLLCKDRTGTSCLVNAGTVYTKCEFKLGVSNQSNADDILSKRGKKVRVESTGCLGETLWDRDKGNVNIITTKDVIKDIYYGNPVVPGAINNQIIFENIRLGFTVNARCKTTGCTASTGFIEVPPNSRTCEDSFVIRESGGSLWLYSNSANETSNGKPVWRLVNSPFFIWDDIGISKNPRGIGYPKIPTVFSASYEGCRVAYVYQPPTNSSFATPLPSVPCIEFTVTTPVPAVIPWNRSEAKDVVLKATGCAISNESGTITWTDHDQPTPIIASDKTGSIKRSFTKEGDYHFDAKCELTQVIATVTVNVSKGKKPPVDFKVTPKASGLILAGGGSVDILLQSTGCTDADPAIPDGTVTWQDPSKAQVAAVPGKIGNTHISLTKPGTYIYTATCSLNNSTLPVEVKVAEQAIPIPIDPCNFYVYTNSQDNFFPTNSYNNIELTVTGGTSIQILPENGAPPITNMGGGKYTASTSSITQPTVFSYLITNNGSGGGCTTRVVITMYDPVTINHRFVASSVTPPSTAYRERPSGNCASYYAGSGAATFGIPWNGNQYQVDKVKRNGHPNLGVFAIYLRKADDDNRSQSNLPDLVGLVDKQCDARKGRLRFYTDYSRSTELLNGASLTPILHVIVPRPERNTTYYGRCFYDEGYCDSEITLSTNINGGGREAASEDSTLADGARLTAAGPCYYSKQAAVKTLLTNVLCDKLSVVQGSEAEKLAAIKTALQQQGIALADITDAMVANLKAGDCANVVKALTNVPPSADDIQLVSDLEKVINNDLVNALVSNALEAIADEDVIDTDFVEREIETFKRKNGLRVGDPNARLADPGTCPEYYFSPAGKRIIVPGVKACTVSINGVLMQFKRGEKTYIPLFSRTTLAFLGYYEQTAFLAKAEKTVVNGKPVDIAPKPALTDWVNDIEYPNEETGIARYRAFIEINKTKPGVILGYDEDTYKQILDILAQFPDLHFQTVEGNGSPFLYDMARHLAQLQTYKKQSDDRLAALVGIVNNPAYVCSVATPPAANADPICKVYSCVYNSSLKNSDRDLLNARLDLDTRKKLLTLLAQYNLTSGWVPVGCAVSADGEGAILSLLSSTQENDRKAILDHIYGSLVQTSYSPLQAFITNLDGANFDALMSLLTSWVSTYYPSSESWSSILQRQDRAKRNILVLGNFTDRYSLSAQYNANQTLLSFEVSIRLSTTQLFKRKIDALDYVVVKFAQDYAAGSQPFEAGRVYTLPAVLVYQIMNAMQRQTRLDLAKYGAYGVFAALGVGEIMAAETGLETTLALLDMGVFGSDIAINEVLATKLNQTADGRAFLDKYNKYTMLYGVTRFYAEFTNLTAELKSLSNKLNDPDVDKLVLKLENQALVAWLSKYPNLLKKVSVLDEATQEVFRSSFAKASDQALTILDGHTASIDTWLIHTDEGKALIGANADIWTSQIQAQTLLKQARYQQVAALLGKSLSTPYTYKGYNYVVEAGSIPDLKVLDDAIAIAGDNTDLAKIATNLSIPQSIVSEVKQHFFVGEHLVPLEGSLTVGRFERTAEDIALWKAAAEHGFTKDVTYIMEGFKFTKPKAEAQADFIRIIAHEYVESKLMKEGISYRGLLGNTDANAYSFGAHDLTIGDKSGNPEYIWKSRLLFNQEPSPFNGNFTRLDPIVNEILTKVK
ncbi:hypothetical protein GCM10028808_26100 [Spirosoma migulaei]